MSVPRHGFGMPRHDPACLDMVFHAAALPCLTQKPESNMPRHDPFMSRHARSVQLLTFSSCRSMTKPYRGMAVLMCKT